MSTTGGSSEPLLLNVHQVASLLACSPRSVWAWSSSGKLPAPITLGWRAKRWFRDEVLEWLEAERRRQRRRGAAVRRPGI